MNKFHGAAQCEILEPLCVHVSEAQTFCLSPSRYTLSAYVLQLAGLTKFWTNTV